MKAYKRKSIFSELKDFCTFARKDDFIEITEWKNGEGFDVLIDSVNKQHFGITYGQFDAIKKLAKKLEKWNGKDEI